MSILGHQIAQISNCPAVQSQNFDLFPPVKYTNDFAAYKKEGTRKVTRQRFRQSFALQLSLLLSSLKNFFQDKKQD